jgi:hypothetical protein
LQEDLGGFPFLIEDQRLYVRKCDLFTVEQIACPEVDLCTADAQYLRDYIAVGGKYNGTLCNMQMCGIWALTCREFTLGLERLAAGGNLIFRFSWRGLDGEEDDEPWYRGLTLKLFSLLYDVFGAVIFFKSEIAHTADETFYVICTGFKKSKYQESGVHDQLRGAETDLRGAPSEKTLFETDFMPGITVTEDVKEKIMGEMGRIEKIMAIGQAAREWSQAKWSKRMKEKEESGDATETTKEGSGEGSVHSDVPPEVAGHCADQRFYRVRISPRPSAIVKARMIAVPNFRRLCQAHGRVERIWVDQTTTSFWSGIQIGTAQTKRSTGFGGRCSPGTIASSKWSWSNRTAGLSRCLSRIPRPTPISKAFRSSNQTRRMIGSASRSSSRWRTCRATPKITTTIGSGRSTTGTTTKTMTEATHSL